MKAEEGECVKGSPPMPGGRNKLHGFVWVENTGGYYKRIL